MKGEGIDYNQYRMKPSELILTLVLSVGTMLAVGLIFYDNLIISFFLSLSGALYIPIRKKQLIRRRKEILNLQFKDALYFISVALSSGKSVENSLIDCQRALEGIYPDKSSDMISEFEIINAKITMNMSIEKAFQDLATRSGTDDIKSFSDVFSISKRAGANLVEVMKNTSAVIREKIEVKQEIENIISSKKLEQRILSLTPFVLVFIIKNTSNGFLDPLFNTAAGRIVMTIALIMILGAHLISGHIINIKV